MTQGFPKKERYPKYKMSFLVIGIVVFLSICPGCSKKDEKAIKELPSLAPGTVQQAVKPDTTKPQTPPKKTDEKETVIPGFICEKNSPDEKTCRRITPDIFE